MTCTRYRNAFGYTFYNTQNEGNYILFHDITYLYKCGHNSWQYIMPSVINIALINQ